MMDNVVDVSGFPLEEQAHEANAKRRIGLGITGLADALIMCGARYGSRDAVRLDRNLVEGFAACGLLGIRRARQGKRRVPAVSMPNSTWLAKASRNWTRTCVTAIAEHGIRNALLTSVAPTGTISLFADNVSSGLEPVFQL